MDGQGDELEDIRFRRMGYDVGRWILLDCLVFTGELRGVRLVGGRKDEGWRDRLFCSQPWWPL